MSFQQPHDLKELLYLTECGYRYIYKSVLTGDYGLVENLSFGVLADPEEFEKLGIRIDHQRIITPLLSAKDKHDLFAPISIADPLSYQHLEEVWTLNTKGVARIEISQISESYRENFPIFWTDQDAINFSELWKYQP